MKKALVEACNKFGICFNKVNVILQSQHHFIGSYIKNGEQFILRLTNESHRSLEMIKAEINWIHYLFQTGISVSCPIPSQSGQFVEKIELENGYVTAVSFIKAVGRSLTEEELYQNDDLISEMGRFMGKMHTATKGYNPISNDAKRPQWFEEAENVATICLPESETEIIHEYNRLNQILSKLPISSESYGLVHMDFHYNNLFFDGGKFTIFDFDACRYSWFVNDIAVALFYAIPLHMKFDERKVFGQRFIKKFLEGYQKENHLDNEWIKSIPTFARHREIGRYIKIYHSFGGNLELLTGWTKDFMNNRNKQIVENTPIVDLEI
ncbi:phosphotransferase [Bacillus sp. RG28]|uniref:Phosphotransferase n=1 Tax=Gottfriedia endophytica TaxID=2820819 RepID=A0A940NGU3_9BACI|nr:phosphotransferase [Gottfriedia endophytica]MBP0723732.1 phosphotransferase [Gottfriedia endophytica]